MLCDKSLYGNVIHYRLCLPAYLAEAILENHHTRLSHHFNVQQTKQYFNRSFYAFNLDKIVSKIVKSCTICQLCRNTYKRQFIGESRTFGSDVSPGRVLCSDICYMPRDTVTGHKYLALYVDRLTSYVCGVPLKTLDSNAVRNSFYEYLCHFPPPQVIQVDGGPEYSGTFEDFCHQQQILVKTSIPRSPQTNGTAEAAVKSIKNILTRACAANPQGINNHQL